jgi:hypothetical protein
MEAARPMRNVRARCGRLAAGAGTAAAVGADDEGELAHGVEPWSLSFDWADIIERSEVCQCGKSVDRGDVGRMAAPRDLPPPSCSARRPGSSEGASMQTRALPGRARWVCAEIACARRQFRCRTRRRARVANRALGFDALGRSPRPSPRSRALRRPATTRSGVRHHQHHLDRLRSRVAIERMEKTIDEGQRTRARYRGRPHPAARLVATTRPRRDERTRTPQLPPTTPGATAPPCPTPSSPTNRAGPSRSSR